MAEDDKIRTQRLLVEHHRELNAIVGDPPTLRRELEDYAIKIKYHIYHQESLVKLGLRMRILAITGRGRTARASKADRAATTYPTLASKKDVTVLAERGYEIERGDQVHKDPLRCSKAQLMQMAEFCLRQETGWKRRAMRLSIIHLCRFGTQLALPFEIPMELQMRMIEETEEQLRLLRERAS